MTSQAKQPPRRVRASPTELMRLAASLVKDGRAADAAALYLSVLLAARSKLVFDAALSGYLDASPPVAEGVIASRLTEARVHLDAGRVDVAREALQEVLYLDPSIAEVYVDLGWIILAEDRFEAATDAFRRALFLENENGQAMLGLAECYLRQGRTELAAACFRAAESMLADKDDRLPGLAARFLELDEIEPAGVALARWMGKDPDPRTLEDLIKRFTSAIPERIWKLCIALLERNSFDAAVALMGAALTGFQPDSADIAAAARLLRKAGYPAVALDLLRGPHLTDPDRPSIQVEIGMACMALDLDEEAIVSFKQTIEQGGFEALCLNNIGICHRRCGRYREGAEYSLRAFLRDTSAVRALNNMGLCYDALHEGILARSCFDAALAQTADLPEIRLNRSFSLLRDHQFEEGWADYRSRWSVKKPNCPVHRFDAKEWDGERVGRLLLWQEQGVGDEVMFASCFGDLLAQSERLIVGVDRRLLPLFRRSFGDGIEFRAMDMDEARLRPDAQSAIGDAVGLVRPTLDSFASSAGGYLVPDRARVENLRTQLEGWADRQRIVGISWKSKGILRARHRNLTAEALVGALPEGLCLVNLQYGDVQHEITTVAQELGRDVYVLPEVDLFGDLDGLAALIAACDVVVSVDNLNVHFAGALGVPCHVLVPFVSDWRWGAHGSTHSYWYTALRLHWQKTQDDWTECLADLRRFLEDSSTHA